MTPEQFCYWLQGRAELLPDTPLSAEEWQSVRDHLQTVFRKETSPMRTTLNALSAEAYNYQRPFETIQFGRNEPNIC